MRVTPAMPEDLPLIADGISDFEVGLVAARYRFSCLELMQQSLSRSECAYVIWNGLDPLLIFGVERASFLTRDGYLWMIGTRHIQQTKVGFARITRKLVGELLTRYSRLLNVLDCNDPQAVKWAQWCGAKMSGEGRWRRFEINA